MGLGSGLPDLHPMSFLAMALGCPFRLSETRALHEDWAGFLEELLID